MPRTSPASQRVATNTEPTPSAGALTVSSSRSLHGEEHRDAQVTTFLGLGSIAQGLSAGD